jgi:2-desacetyl-2-hydroxyethyl bacteriochlorophyllide A dehydrogenase
VFVTTVVRFTGPRSVDLAVEQDAELGAGQVRVRTLYSGISAGTELTAYRGSNPRLTKRWDEQRRLFAPAPGTTPYPVTGWGYEEVGEVVEVGGGVTGYHVGNRVWGVWGHRSEAVMPAQALVGHVLATSVDPLVGVFARAGAIALNAVLAAGIHLGDRVAIFGQGVLGLLATRLATLDGAEVVAVDTLDSRLRAARAQGALDVVDAAHRSAAESVRQLWPGDGVDTCIELSGSYTALHEAIRTVGAGGRVVAAGFYQGPADGLFLGEEFHHNRVELVAAQISAVSNRMAGRWAVDRLLATFMRLVAAGHVDPLPLVSHVIDVEDVSAAFALLDERPHEALQVVLRFPAAREAAARPAPSSLEAS